MWRATGGPRNIQARIPGTAGAHTGLSNLYIWGTGSFGVPRCGQSNDFNKRGDKRYATMSEEDKEKTCKST